MDCICCMPDTDFNLKCKLGYSLKPVTPFPSPIPGSLSILNMVMNITIDSKKNHY